MVGLLAFTVPCSVLCMATWYLVERLDVCANGEVCASRQHNSVWCSSTGGNGYGKYIYDSGSVHGASGSVFVVVAVSVVTEMVAVIGSYSSDDISSDVFVLFGCLFLFRGELQVCVQDAAFLPLI